MITTIKEGSDHPPPPAAEIISSLPVLVVGQNDDEEVGSGNDDDEEQGVTVPSGNDGGEEEENVAVVPPTIRLATDERTLSLSLNAIRFGVSARTRIIYCSGRADDITLHQSVVGGDDVLSVLNANITLYVHVQPVARPCGRSRAKPNVFLSLFV